jgi:hypothetical protein
MLQIARVLWAESRNRAGRLSSAGSVVKKLCVRLGLTSCGRRGRSARAGPIDLDSVLLHVCRFRS